MTRNHVSIGGFAVSRIQDTAFADDLQPDAATDTQNVNHCEYMQCRYGSGTAYIRFMCHHSQDMMT